MKITALALVPLALGSLTASAASDTPALPAVPHAILAPIGSVAPELRAELSWTAWPVGRPQLRQPVAVQPSSAGDWLAGTVLAPPGEAVDWVLVGIAGPRALSLLSRSAEIPGAPVEIVPPRPIAQPQPGRVVLTWTAAEAPALQGWTLQRSANGAAWSSLETLDPTAVSVADPVAEGTWAYRFVPVLLGDVALDAPGLPSEPVRATDGDRDDDGIADDADGCDVAPGNDCSWTWGDVAPPGAPDGVIRIGDAVRLLRFAVGVETPTAAELLAADVAPALLSGSTAHPQAAAPRIVDIEDAVLALRAAVGLVSLPPPR